MSATNRFYAARLAGTTVFDPLGDAVGRVRDVVVLPRARSARAVGLVVEVPGKRRVFLPMTRITAIDIGQVIISGVLNVRRFEKRRAEQLVIGDLLDRVVTLTDGTGEATVEDVALDRSRHGDWDLARLHVRRLKRGRSLSKLMAGRGEQLTVTPSEVSGLFGSSAEQSAALLLASYEDLNAADMADIFQELDPKRRTELAAELSDDRLADVLEELPEDTRVELVTTLEASRAADVLEVMDPDDAADVVQELPDGVAQQLLGLMEPEEAEDVRRLLAYDEYTAGGLMTTEPLIVAPETPVAHCLAMISREELSPAHASVVHVCRSPLETPTGRMLGIVHFQHLLRERPDRPVGEIVDLDRQVLPPSAPLSEVTREMATYNLVSIPVCDDEGRLLGAVTVDDVLDHVLPEDWREQDEVVPTTTGQIDLAQIARGMSAQDHGRTDRAGNANNNTENTEG